MQDAGCMVQGAGCRVQGQGAGCRVQDAGCRMQGQAAGGWMEGAGCRMQGAGCRVVSCNSSDSPFEGRSETEIPHQREWLGGCLTEQVRGER